MKKEFHFRLFILGKAGKSIKAITNLKKLCDEYLSHNHLIDVVDLEENIQLAEDNEVWATPLLERLKPLPVIRIAGDLSDNESLIEELGIN